MSKIISIGVATLDIINHVDHYPREDEELRASGQERVRGGNAANTACVLAQLGHQVEFIGALADDTAAQHIRADLTGHAVGMRFCATHSHSHSPTSSITLNDSNGSRTIVHYRDLPELTASDVRHVPWAEFDWFHLEGRQVDATLQILRAIEAVRVDQAISIEIEKERPDIEALLPLADVLLFSRAFIAGRGFDQAEAFFAWLRTQGVNALLISAWGEQGAYAQDQQDKQWHAPAQPPQRIVDSIGAGDTFNAGVIAALCAGRTLEAAIAHGCLLAGKKLAQRGFAALRQTL